MPLRAIDSWLLHRGASGGLFGPDKATGAASALAGVTGMTGGSATNLLMLAVPIVFSVLKRFIGENRLDAGGLAALFAGQKDFLAGKLDPRLASALGLGACRQRAVGARARRRAAGPRRSAQQVPRQEPRRWRAPRAPGDGCLG